MKRKYYYGMRILYNIIRVPLRKVVFNRRLKLPIIQNMSPQVRMRIFGNGNIRIEGRLTVEDGVLIEANNGTVNIESCFINRNSTIVSIDKITIEKGVTIGPNVCIYDHDHNTSLVHDKTDAFMSSPVTICEKSWIGANAVILKGVTVGKNSIVAAGSVVTANVPDNTIVGGIPAKRIGERH